MMQELQSALDSIIAALPNILWGILLLIVAWIVAALVRRASRKGMEKAKLDQRLVNWGVAADEDLAKQSIQSISQVFYYLVWVLFLPSIFQRFGLTAIARPITNMIDTALNFIPNLLGAAVLIIIGLVVGKFLYNLVYNFSVSLNLDGLISNFTQSGSDSEKENEDEEEEGHLEAVDPSSRSARSSRSSLHAQKQAGNRNDSIAKVLGTIAYILIFIPILTVALETLGIQSISRPIIGVLNSIMSAIPNLLLAVILLGVGIFIAKIVGDLVRDLLAGAGVDRLNQHINSGDSHIEISKVTGHIVTAIIALFIAVEALNVLNLAVLNTIGTALIAYLPNIIIAIIILALGLIGGRLVANFVASSLGSRWLAGLIQAILGILAIFMALDQLNFATSIVNSAFMFIIGGASIAFAIAFGVGGRDFARKQLEKLDEKLDYESEEIKRNMDQNSDDYQDSDSDSYY